MSRTCVYVSNAADGDIATFSMQPDGALQPGARVKAADAVGPMAVTPDGRFLYISERTSCALAAFSVNAATGKLTYLASTPTESQPRGFAIEPKGRFLVAAGEKSETISLHAIDQASGALALQQQCPGGKGANWVEIVRFG